MNAKRITKFWEIIVIIFSILGIVLAVDRVFMLKISPFVNLDNQYLYYLLAIYLSLAFIIYPAKKGDNAIKWYDIVLYLFSLIINVYLGYYGFEIISNGWQWNAPIIPTIMAIILWIIVLEAVRRTGGIVLFIICTLFSLFPLVAQYMPGVLQGQGYSFLDTARMHVIGSDSILGLPLTTVGILPKFHVCFLLASKITISRRI